MYLARACQVLSSTHASAYCNVYENYSFLVLFETTKIISLHVKIKPKGI